MKLPNKDCQQDCRFQAGLATTTCMYFAPIFDKNGVNLNPDGNITSQMIVCTTCNKKWLSTTRFNETTFEEIIGNT